jgi:phosphoglycerol transferase MdoB-like AlkP superfamily enzyme
MVLGFGLLFVFLTFHSGDKNYIYLIMTGVQQWSCLGPYLSLNLFFQAPFLGAWLFGYALVYYVLARTGRESWMLYVTAACAGAYGLICLQELASHRDELLVADCFGAASLLAVRGGRKALGLGWLLLPALWALFIWVLFRLATADLAQLNPYFTMLLGDSLVLFGAATLWAKRQGFFGVWSGLVLFYFTAFLLLTSINYPMATNYNNLLCVALEFPRYFIGELVVAAAVALCAGLYCRIWPKAGLWWLDALNLLFVAVAFVDLRLSEIMGVRLEWNILSLGNSPKMMWRMARPYLPGALMAMAVVIVLYVAALRGMQRWQRRSLAAAGTYPPARGGWFVAACFLLMGAVGLGTVKPDKAEGQAALNLVETNPLWKRAASRPLGRNEFLRSAAALGLGDFGTAGHAAPVSPRRDLNVVLVFMESSYNKHLSLFGSSEQTQPLLSRHKDRMELFPNFFSNFASSIHARFAAFTSLYPVRDFSAFTLERVKVKSLFEVMHDSGYSCSMFYSSFFDYTGFRDFLKQRQLDEMYDADTMPGQRASERVSWGLREEETLGAIRGRLKQYAATGQRFFLTYVPAAPHYPYDRIPEAFRKFKPDVIGDYTPLYLNELLYMDWVLSSLVDQLDEAGLLDKTLVIITNDHGEMLGNDGNPVGHGWALKPELVNTPLIIMDPKNPGYHLNYAIGSEVDLLPTVLDRLGIPLPTGQLYEGRSLDSSRPPADRLIYLSSYQQYAVIDGPHLVFGDRKAPEDDAAGAKRTAYAISNQGSRTLFPEDGFVSQRPVSIRRFDQFQENLLRNYSVYRETVFKDQR